MSKDQIQYFINNRAWNELAIFLKENLVSDADLNSNYFYNIKNLNLLDIAFEHNNISLVKSLINKNIYIEQNKYKQYFFNLSSGWAIDVPMVRDENHKKSTLVKIQIFNLLLKHIINNNISLNFDEMIVNYLSSACNVEGINTQDRQHVYKSMELLVSLGASATILGRRQSKTSDVMDHIQDTDILKKLLTLKKIQT